MKSCIFFPNKMDKRKQSNFPCMSLRRAACSTPACSRKQVKAKTGIAPMSEVRLENSWSLIFHRPTVQILQEGKMSFSLVEWSQPKPKE